MIWIQLFEWFEDRHVEIHTGSGGHTDTSSFHQHCNVPYSAILSLFSNKISVPVTVLTQLYQYKGPLTRMAYFSPWGTTLPRVNFHVNLPEAGGASCTKRALPGHQRPGGKCGWDPVPHQTPPSSHQEGSTGASSVETWRFWSLPQRCPPRCGAQPVTQRKAPGQTLTWWLQHFRSNTAMLLPAFS